MKIWRLVMAFALLISIQAFGAFDPGAELSRSEIPFFLKANPEMSWQTRDGLLGRLEQYRLEPSTSAVQAVKDAPYPFMVLSAQLGEIYQTVYESERRAQYQKIVVELPLEVLFDAFLKQIVEGTLSESAREAGDKIGVCLAQKSLKASGEGCVLGDSSEPGLGALLAAKVSCVIPLKSNCSIRRTIFNAAKPQLLAAQQDPEVRKQVEEAFNKRFPGEFRAGFMGELTSKLQAFPQLLLAKLEASGKEGNAWFGRLPVVEGVRPGEELVLGDYIAGVRADLHSAVFLMGSKTLEARAAAAALFYAAANKLLILNGGKRALWDGKALLLEPSSAGTGEEAVADSTSPKLLSEPFGGFAFATDNGSFGAWDFAAYSSSKDLVLFPAIFTVNENFVAAQTRAEGSARVEASAGVVENLADLMDLLETSIEFLAFTAPGAPLGDYFIDSAQFEKVLDPASPAIFPNEGRLLAVGIMAGVLKNLLGHPGGHVQLPKKGEIAKELKIVIHEWIETQSKSQQPVSIVAMGRLLTVVSKLRDYLQTSKDPILPPEMTALVPELAQALQVGALILSSDGEAPAGEFYDRLKVPGSSPEKKFESTVSGLMALTRAYNRSKMLPLRLAIRVGWEAFERAWKAGALSGRKYPPTEIWRLVELWSETEKFLTQDLRAEYNFEPWRQRVQLLRNELNKNFENLKAEPAERQISIDSKI